MPESDDLEPIPSDPLNPINPFNPNDPIDSLIEDEILEDQVIAKQPPKKGKRGAKDSRSLATNLSWTLLRTIGMMIMQLLVVVVLSRYLTVQETAWAGVITLLTGLTDMISKMGVAPALIQRAELNKTHLSTGYIASIAIGFFQTVLVFAFAGPIANYLKQPEVAPYLRVVSLVFVVTAISRIAGTLLKRDLRFNKTVQAELISSYVYVGALVLLLMMHTHLWGFVAATILQSVVLTGLLLLAERPPKPFVFSMTAYKELMVVGKGFTASALLYYAASNGDNFVVTREAPGLFGFYTRAFNLMSRPAGILTKTVNLVLFPTMARNTDDPEQLKSLFKKTTTAIALLVMPTGVVLAIVGPEILRLLSPASNPFKWDGAIIPFEILSAGMFFRVGNQASDSLTQATGHLKAIVYPKAVYAITVVAFSFIGARMAGIIGVSWGVLIANAIHTLYMAQQSLAITKLSWGTYFKALWAPLVITVLSGGATFAATMGLRMANVGNMFVFLGALITAALVGAAVLFFGGEMLLGEIMLDIKKTIGKKISKKGRKGAAA